MTSNTSENEHKGEDNLSTSALIGSAASTEPDENSANNLGGATGNEAGDKTTPGGGTINDKNDKSATADAGGVD